MESRLDRLEAASGLDRESPRGPAQSFRQRDGDIRGPTRGRAGDTRDPSSTAHVTDERDRPGTAPKQVTVVVEPLVDLSLARAVETSALDADGIEEVRLRALSGDSAMIDASVKPGVSVISALRRSLPVAFDVTEAEELGDHRDGPPGVR